MASIPQISSLNLNFPTEQFQEGKATLLVPKLTTYSTKTSSEYLPSKAPVFIERIGFYVKKKFIDTELESKLKEIAELIQSLNGLRAKREKIIEERDSMTDEQARLRENISVLGDDTQSISLKERYIKKLNAQENRFEEINKEIKTLEVEIRELNKKIQDEMKQLSPP